MKNDDLFKQIKGGLKSGNNDCLRVIFEEYGEYCTRLLKRNTNCTSQDAEDILIDSIINFREKMISGKIDYLSNLKGYIYSTCYNMWLTRYEKDKNKESKLDDLKQLYEESENEGVKSMMSSVVNDSLKSLGGKCQEIILLFYYENLSMERIAEELGFASAGVAKTTKSRCMNKLTNQVKDQLKKTELKDF